MRQYRTLRVSSIQLAICFFLLCTPAWRQWSSFSQLAYWRSCFTLDQADVRGRKASLFRLFLYFVEEFSSWPFRACKYQMRKPREQRCNLYSLCNVRKCMTIHIYETEDVTQQFLVARRSTIFTANSITKTAKLQLFILTDVTAFRDGKNKGRSRCQKNPVTSPNLSKNRRISSNYF